MKGVAELVEEGACVVPAIRIGSPAFPFTKLELLETIVVISLLKRSWLR